MASSPRRYPLPSSRPQAAFTLVEVALAIGIVAFAFVSLMALLPAGNTAFRKSMDVAICGQIAQRVISDAQQADFTTLTDMLRARADELENTTFRAPRRDLELFRYFDNQGREVFPDNETAPLTAKQKQQVIYYVNTRIMPRAQLPAKRDARFTITADRAPLAQVTVQVAYNPNHLTLTMSKAAPASDDPMRNLWIPDAKQAGVSIYSYATLVGRND